MKAWTPTPDEYDPEEARIAAWFITGLRHEAIRLTKKYRGLREHELLILNEQFKREEEGREFGEMVNTLAAKSDTQAEAEESIFLQEAFSILTPQQKKVIIGIILEGGTEQEIALELGVTHQAVHRLKERGLKRLKKTFRPGQVPPPSRSLSGTKDHPYPRGKRVTIILF